MACRLLVAFVVIHAVAQSTVAQPPASKQRITTRTLQTQVDIIGPLGAPVGKLVEVEGVAKTRNTKVSNHWIRVDTVDGKKLQQSVEMEYEVYEWANVTRLEQGTKVRLNVYQEIGMRGIPAGVMKQTTPVSVPWRRGLYTWIVVVNQTAPKPLRFRNTYYDNVVGGHPLMRKHRKATTPCLMLHSSAVVFFRVRLDRLCKLSGSCSDASHWSTDDKPVGDYHAGTRAV